MREITIKPGEVVTMGFQGETGATQIRFDVSGWAEEYGEGVFQLVVRAPGSADAYTAAIAQEGDFVLWTVMAEDTAVAGSGYCQLEYYVDTALAKSCGFRTLIAWSVGPSSGYASDAEAWAIGERDGEPVQETDETYHNNAKYYAGEAEASAEQAATSADSALETVRAAGTEQVQRVQAAGETQIQAVAQEGAARQAAVVDEGSTQVQRVQTAGAAAAESTAEDIQTAGAAQIQSIDSAAADQLQAIGDMGAVQKAAVVDEGSTQVQRVWAAGDQAATGVEASVEAQGNTQIQRVQDAAGEQIAEITQEGSDQRGAVADAGTAEIQRIQTVGAQASDAIGDMVEIAEAAQAAATQSASDAETAKDAAAQGAAAAQTAAERAAQSATDAAGSATDAAGSATAAAGSATQAAGSATAAAASATEAETSRGQAAQSATDAAASATEAAGSATQAAGSATAAAASAAAAQTAAERDVPAAAAAWLSEHVDPSTGYVLDDSLTIQGAAADAKAVGDAIDDVKSQLDAVNDALEYDAEKTLKYLGHSRINGSGTTQSNANFNAYKIPVAAGEKITVDSKWPVTTSSENAGVTVAFYSLEYEDLAIPQTTTYVVGIGTKYQKPQEGTVFVAEYTVPETAKSALICGDKTYNVKVTRDEIYGKEDIEARFSADETAIAKKVEDGYIDITQKCILYGQILTGSVGNTITLDPKTKSGYMCIALPVLAGDKYRVGGEASAVARLWGFTDTAYKVLSLSATFLHDYDIELVAESDGYLIFNSNIVNAPKIEKYITSVASLYTEMHDKAAYVDKNTDNDILSAFTNIMCCGDSLTASVVYTGMDGSTNITRAAYRRYPEILASKTGATVDYHALGGYTAVNWWAAYNQYIVAKTNQLAIIYIGTNGGLTDTIETDAPGDNIADYDKTTNTGAYCAIVKSFIDVGARVLLIHINKRDTDLFLTNDVIDKIAEKFNVAVVTVPFLSDNKYHSWPDGTGSNSIHYNDLGYAAFTESLIKNVGALSDEMMIRLIPQ